MLKNWLADGWLVAAAGSQKGHCTITSLFTLSVQSVGELTVDKGPLNTLKGNCCQQSSINVCLMMQIISWNGEHKPKCTTVNL